MHFAADSQSLQLPYRMLHLLSPSSNRAPNRSLPCSMILWTCRPRLRALPTASSRFFVPKHAHLDRVRRWRACHCSYASCASWNSRSISHSVRLVCCGLSQETAIVDIMKYARIDSSKTNKQTREGGESERQKVSFRREQLFLIKDEVGRIGKRTKLARSRLRRRNLKTRWL